MQPITDHAGRAVARLATQLRGKPKMQTLVRALARQAQEIEDAAWPILLETVETAAGVQLDKLGRLVGQARSGRTDAGFRLWIRARVLLNRSSGTPEQILTLFTTLTAGSAARVVNEEQYPAGFVLRALGPLDEPRALADVLHAAKLGGVRAILEHLHTQPAAAFSFAGGPGLGFNAGAIASAVE
jgi:hypothetical protein